VQGKGVDFQRSQDAESYLVLRDSA
jgi:hypothetical protein